MLQAYIDDSHDTSSAFVLAGYIAPAENWAAFSDVWRAILDTPVPFFKMSKAHSGRSEEQWNKRLPLLYRAIKNHVFAGVSVHLGCKINFFIAASQDLDRSDAVTIFDRFASQPSRFLDRFFAATPQVIQEEN